jgi:hypothetical protein
MENTEMKPLSDRLKEAAAAMRGAIADEQLDPGIADVVIMLRNLGFNPTDSGDGRSKPDDQRDFDVKHVACSWQPAHDGRTPAANGEPTIPAFDESGFFNEARRLHSVLGWGWKVEASFDPSAGGSYILLATKNEEPGPRHAEALRGWPFELRDYSPEQHRKVVQRRVRTS